MVNLVLVTHTLRGIAAVLCVPLLAACSSGSREDESAAAAQRYLAAVSGGDLTTACQMLSDTVRDSLIHSEGECEQALGSLELPAGSVQEVVVWGDRAQARTGSDTLFLAEFTDGWKVVAAGCSPRDDSPYQCMVGSS